MTRKEISRIQKPGFEQVAFVEAGRCDADGWYWCIRVDGGTYADGVEATEELATERCRKNLEEMWELD